KINSLRGTSSRQTTGPKVGPPNCNSRCRPFRVAFATAHISPLKKCPARREGRTEQNESFRHDKATQNGPCGPSKKLVLDSGEPGPIRPCTRARAGAQSRRFEARPASRIPG